MNVVRGQMGVEFRVKDEWSSGSNRDEVCGQR